MRIASDACIYTNDSYTALHIDGATGKIQDIDINTFALPAPSDTAATAAAAAAVEGAEPPAGGTSA